MEIDKIAIILEAAEKAFVRYGYQKTSMDDIAKEAMIGKGSLYYYFDSKEDIYIAVLKKCVSEMIKVLTSKIKRAKTFEEKFKVYFAEPHKEFVANESLISPLWNAELPIFMTKLCDFKAEIHQQLKSLLLQIFMYGVKTGKINHRYNDTIEKIVEVIHNWMVTSGEYVVKNPSHFTADHHKEQLLFIDIFLNGLLAQEETK